MRVNRTTRRLGLAVLALAAVVANAQSTPETPSLANPVPEVGGKNAIELVRLHPGTMVIPLRQGHVIPSSERVDLEGRDLVRDQDYSIDYDAGSIVLRVPYLDGQSLRLTYRYDDKKDGKGVFMHGGGGNNKFSGFTMDFAPGSKAIFGLGLAERTSGGTLMSSNLYGLTNSYSLAGGGSLSGLFMVGDRHKVDSENLIDGSTTTEKVDEGQGTAIVQNLATKVLGGQFKASYQDIDDRFGAFQSFASAGYSQAQIDELAKEKGLKRSGFELTGVKAGDLKLSGGVQTVGDDTGSVSWRNYGMGLGGFSFTWDSRVVDPTFNRFDSLREADRNQLAKERGLSFDNIGAKQEFKGGALQYTDSRTQDQNGTGLYRRAMSLDYGKSKAWFSDQKVDNGFSRFGDLRDADRGQLAKEVGLARHSFGLESPFAKGWELKFSDNQISSDTGGLVATKFSIASPKFSVQHGSIGSGSGFTSFSSLTPQETKGYVDDVLAAAGNPRAEGGDIGAFGYAAGLERSWWNLNLDLGKQSKLAADTYSVNSQTGGARQSTVRFESPKVKAGFTQQGVSDTFGAAGQLMPTEQKAVGISDGLGRTAFSLSADLMKSGKINLDTMHAADATGEAARTDFSYTDKGFEGTYARRNVTSMFNGLATMADPQRNVFQQLMGYDQTAWSLKWQLLPSLKVDFKHNNDQNTDLNIFREVDNKLIEYKLDRLTAVSFQTMLNRVNDIDHVNQDQSAQLFTVARDFGKLGKLTVVNEQASFSGTQDTQPDSNRNAVVYEANLSKTTALRTEQSETKYSNGDRETTTANTIAQQITPRVQVSLTDERTLRDGDRPDDAKKNFGVSVDFGKGIKLDVNSARHLDGPTDGTLNNRVSLTPGQIQGVQVDSASYTNNSWDDKRNQNIGNFSFKNVKPFSFGGFHDLRFNYSSDTARDNFAWQKENLRMGFGGSYGNIGFGFDYISQVAGDGFRAIDRVLTLTTDKTGKAAVRGDVKYGVRTLPTDENVMIRDYSFLVNFNDHAQLVHQMTTNPLQQRNDVILGSVPVDERKNTWSFNYTKDNNFKFDMSWSEVARDAVAQSLYREAKINTTFFASNPSPLNLSFSLLQWDRNGERQTANKIGLHFDQRPGKNQSLSFWLENLNWGDSRPAGANLQNWGMRLDYSVRF